MPPELNEPFATVAARVAAREDLVRYSLLVRQVTEAVAGAAPATWLIEALNRPLRGVREAPMMRLDRYASVFAEELAALRSALDVGDVSRLSDESLRAALYLAKRLLASLLDCSIDDLDRQLPHPSLS